MLQRDYILRLIQEFFAALARMLHKNEGRLEEEDLRRMYKQFVGEFDTLRNLSYEETLHFAREQWGEEERTKRLEMLAELLYVEGIRVEQPLQQLLLTKAYKLFEHVTALDKTYNADRIAKQQHVLQIIKTV